MRSRVIPVKMTREDIMKMSTEELCAIRTPEEVEGYSAAEGRHIIDPEFDAYIAERIGHLSAPYVAELEAGFKDGRRDVSEMVSRFEQEPPIVKMHVWGGTTTRGIDNIELVKYVHLHLAKSILRIFGCELPEKELENQQKTFDRYTKRK